MGKEFYARFRKNAMVCVLFPTVLTLAALVASVAFGLVGKVGIGDVLMFNLIPYEVEIFIAVSYAFIKTTEEVK